MNMIEWDQIWSRWVEATKGFRSRWIMEVGPHPLSKGLRVYSTQQNFIDLVPCFQYTNLQLFQLIYTRFANENPCLFTGLLFFMPTKISRDSCRGSALDMSTSLVSNSSINVANECP